MEVVKVQANSYTQQVYDYIVRKIYNGEYPPGMRLKDVHLSKEIGVSTTPVREAIRQLEKDFWVTIVPYSGAHVKKLGLKEMEDLYDLRCALEGLAVRLAIDNMDQKILNKFSIIMEEEEKLIHDSKAINESMSFEKMPDLRFHKLITETSKNERLQQIIINSELQARIIPASYGSRDHDIELIYRTHNEHLAILKAIEDKNKDMAEELIKKHLSWGKEREIAVLKKNGGFNGDKET